MQIKPCFNDWGLKSALRLRKNEQRTLKIQKGLIDFVSNDYLGLARSKELKTRIAQKLAELTHIGATGSRLLTGESDRIATLESKLAQFHGGESGLLFSSGYCANLGLLAAVATREHLVLYDEKVHASLRDGMTLSRAQHWAFRHNDLNHLETLLQKAHKPTFVVVESVYSTDGNLAPLKEIDSLCHSFGAKLIVDEAHATGVFGPGFVAQHKLDVFARIHTFGKALGVQGAIVIGSHSLRDHLINHSRPFIYTTAPSHLFVIAIESAYELLGTRAFDLLSLCHYAGMKSPISAIPMGSVKSTKKSALFLQKEGFDLRPLLYPTVARGEECLRLCLHSFNTKEEVDALYETLDCYRD